MKEFVRAFSGLMDVNFPAKLSGHSPNKWQTIGAYWYRLIPLHLLVILSAGVLLYFVSGGNCNQSFTLVFLTVCMFTGIVLFFTLYLPNFFFRFLPSLPAPVREQPVRIPTEPVFLPKEKCRQSQLSNPALCLVFHVLQKSSGMESLPADDASAATLNQLFGVDPGSLKKNLRFFFGPASGRANLSERKQTEIRNRFQEARAFFEALSFPNGIRMLNDLEEKVLS